MDGLKDRCSEIECLAVRGFGVWLGGKEWVVRAGWPFPLTILRCLKLAGVFSLANGLVVSRSKVVG